MRITCSLSFMHEHRRSSKLRLGGDARCVAGCGYTLLSLSALSVSNIERAFTMGIRSEGARPRPWRRSCRSLREHIGARTALWPVPGFWRELVQTYSVLARIGSTSSKIDPDDESAGSDERLTELRDCGDDTEEELRAKQKALRLVSW